MSKMDVTVSVEKSGYDLLQHLGHLIKAVKGAGGFKAEAIPADVAALVADLPAIVSDVGAIPADLAEDKLAFVKGCNLGIYELADAALGK